MGHSGSNWNKEFHGLKYDDFIRDVNAADKIAEKYRHGAGGDAK